MTPEELQIIQLRSQILATQTVLIGLIRALARSSPNAKLSLRETVNNLRNQYSQMTIPGMPAEYSDLLAAEFQSALDDLIKLIEK